MGDWERADAEPPLPSRVYLRLAVGVSLGLATNVAVFVGTLALFALTASQEPTRWASSYVMAGFSLLQWPLLLPIGVYGVWRRAPLALGLVIGGVLVTLVNTGCSTWLAFLSGWFVGP